MARVCMKGNVWMVMRKICHVVGIPVLLQMFSNMSDTALLCVYYLQCVSFLPKPPGKVRDLALLDAHWGLCSFCLSSPIEAVGDCCNLHVSREGTSPFILSSSTSHTLALFSWRQLAVCVAVQFVSSLYKLAWKSSFCGSPGCSKCRL